jgi:carbamoyltransferase
LTAILGRSGLTHSVDFQSKNLPALEGRGYRISQGHDPTADLIINGRIVVAAEAEERFNRRKHFGDFPAAAIDFCLREGGIEIADVDETATSFNCQPLPGNLLSIR